MTTVNQHQDGSTARPFVRVDVVEAGDHVQSGWIACVIGGDLSFSTDHLENYCLTQWEPIVFDALLLTAAVEFCDRIRRRPTHGWARDIELRVPVHEPERWNDNEVSNALHDALMFLTGDCWTISFTARKQPVSIPRQIPFDISSDISAVIPFSDGLDSCAVAGLMHEEMGDQLIRVRLGSKPFTAVAALGKKQPFTSLPYWVKPTKGQFVESSVRSRGFKFAMVSGLAAYLVKANRIIVPESGQGALGPALIPVGQAYGDYRNHPLFTDRMESLLAKLYKHSVRFEFPRLWHTKGETLAAFLRNSNGHNWKNTWSCWQQNRHVSVAGRKRQCGICAACMLRRLSIHAAGLWEDPETYVWENLGATIFEDGAAAGFSRITKAHREYAIAGTLHLGHLASLSHSKAGRVTIHHAAFEISKSQALPAADACTRLDRLLSQHESEWKCFLTSLGVDSFVAEWAAQS